MAKLRGTGKDPAGHYIKGQVFDVPSDQPEYEELVEKGYAEKVELPADTETEHVLSVANGVVRGDVVAHPKDEEYAEKIEGDEHAIVHEQNPKAKGDGQPEQPRARRARERATAGAGAAKE